MRTSIQRFNYRLLCLLLLVLAGTQSACKKNDGAGGAPTITGIRAYLASPADSVLTRVGPGTAIVIQGSGLKTAKRVEFDGIAAQFNPALLSDGNLVVTIPAGIPFANVPAEQMNTVRVVTDGGETTFKFPIQAPPPVVAAVSNEFAFPGDYITLSGSYLYLIKKITFPGNLDATDITALPDGSSVRVKVPAGLKQGGQLQVTTQFGSTTAPFNDKTGMLLDFDGVGSFVFGSTITNDATLFPGGTGSYAHFAQDAIPAYNYEWYNGKRAIVSQPMDWVPDSELSKPAAAYALKFEIFVKQPLSTGVLLVGPPPDDWKYLARYEPWKTTPNFTTPGWTTVTLPLDQFKTKSAAGADGGGTPATTVNDVVGDIKEIVRFMYFNDTAVPLAKLDLAIDNVRVVKLPVKK